MGPIDVTNRDGVQTSRICLSKLQKTILNMYLDKMGIFQSEFGFPTTNHEINYLNANIKLKDKGIIKNLRLSGWVRAIREDVELAFKNVKNLKHLNLSISTSEQMIKHKFKGKLDGKGVIKNMVDAVKTAIKLGAEAVGVNAEDASRSNLDYLVEFVEAAKQAGAERFRYCDTLGFDTPFSIYERLSYILDKTKIPVEVHCHNDLGLAVASSVAAAKAT